MSTTSDAPPRCANHPSVETWVSCATCEKPICPDCMVTAPVGIKCTDCARMPRSARVRLRPSRALRAIGAAAAVAVAVGFGLSALALGSVGFLGFLLAYGVGYGMGEAVKRASGYYRGRESGWIAAGGALLAYVLPLLFVPVLFGHTTGQQFRAAEVLLGLVAAFFAYRQTT